MKIKNLRKISRNILLGSTLLSMAALTSCSTTLTSLRGTEKMQNQQVLSMPLATQAVQATPIPTYEIPLAAVPQATGDAIVPYVHKTVPMSSFKARPRLFATRSFIVKDKITRKIENQIASIQRIGENTRVMADKHATHSLYEGWVRRALILILVALIFYIIGALFPWPLSTVFYIIGSIFLIFGLVYLLMGLLGSM